jgi:hypothetical protein
MSKATAPGDPATIPAAAAPSRNYLPALAVYVVWHPNNARGGELARALLDELTADSDDPLARGIGIPVYFRTGTPAAAVPAEIELGQAKHTAVIVLVDDEMIRDRGNGWSAYVDEIWKRTNQNQGEHRMLPVAMTQAAFNFSKAIADVNFIRSYQGDGQKQLIGLTVSVTDELCRLLLREPRADHDNPEAAPVSDRVKVFISHAKADGRELAEAINGDIHNRTQLVTFLDVHDIEYGKIFTDVILDEAARCAMLAVQTDVYGSRPWCQKEILQAKAAKRPVLVLDALARGELRSFPYAGNGPRLRYDAANGIDVAMVAARMLLEVLRVEHAKQQFEGLRELFNIPEGEGIEFLPYPPELLTLAELRLRERAAAPGKKPATTFVYSDPPLGLDEMERLRVFAGGLHLVTTTMLLAEGERRATKPGAAAAGPGARPTEEQGKKLTEAAAAIPEQGGRPDGWRVGLSLSNGPDEELLALGMGPMHLARTMAEFARYLLVANYRLAYGGDLRGGGFTENLHDLVKTYNDENHGPEEALVNYLAWYVHKAASAAEMARYSAAAEQVPVALPPDLSQYEAGAYDPKAPDAAYLRARALTKMREDMNQAVKARVILGGRLTDYAGAYPGVVEEAALAIAADRPLYLIGGFGGAARAIIEAIKGGTPPGLTEAYQADEKNNPGYAARVADFNRRAKDSGVAPVDYAKLLKDFQGYTLERLSKHNKLSVEENLKLFTTPHAEEMVYLVLKGLLEVRRQSGG